MFRKNLIILLFLYTTTAFSSDLFTVDINNQIIATKDAKNTLGLILNHSVYEEILTYSPNNYMLILPFFNGNINLELKKNNKLFSNLQIVSKTASGNDELLEVNPDLISYTVYYNRNSVGVVNFVNGSIVATFNISGKQFEITKYKGSYILFEASNSINSSNFTCAVEEHSSTLSIINSNQPESVTTPKCIELALDIDYYTRQTFANDQETTNWALAIISGVSQLYEAQINVGITVVHVQIWNTADPYDTPALNGNAGAMLNEFGNYWNTNNTAINRDLVHLLSKRNNTGTGGIAWLGVLCSMGSGYAFSSALNNDTTFTFPNPSYTWNLMVIAHEIGHNVGSKHTHWCGWVADPSTTPPFTGGPIDNCVDVEGNCPNNPSPQTGTIMSYCHVGGNGNVLDFHEIVISQALIPGINGANCITTCDYYGCTDSTAFNYDPNATVDDSSCIAVIYGCTDSTAANYDPNANTDDGNCTYCASLTFNITHLSCNNSNDGAIDMSVQLGTPPIPLSYTWVGPNGFSSNTEDISNLQPGNYTITATDGLGCIDVISITINNPSPLNLDSINSKNVSCNGMLNGTINVYVSGGTLPYIYNWGGVNPIALGAGTYTVDITDINNCPSVSSTITITEPPVLSSSTSVTDISCYGQGDGSIDLTVLGGVMGYSYQWHGPNSFFDTNEDIFSLYPGTYTGLVTDANGCVNMFNIIITEPPALVAS